MFLEIESVLDIFRESDAAACLSNASVAPGVFHRFSFLLLFSSVRQVHLKGPAPREHFLTFEKKQHLRTVMGWGLCLLLLPFLYSSLLHDALLNYGGEGGKGTAKEKRTRNGPVKSEAVFFRIERTKKPLSSPLPSYLDLPK